MHTAFFMISTDTQGELRRIREREFDALVREPRAWDLFAAIKGDFAWAHGGAIDDNARKHRRGERLYAANIVPLIQLARCRQWLTPSQVSELTSPSEVPDPKPDMDGEERYRKALEKGRRAVDMTVGKQGKLGIWRTIETGPKAANGERKYRFKQHPTHEDGRSVRYCLLWAEDVPDGLVFEPSGPDAENLPLCDGAWGLMQFRTSGLKVTVRDIVWSGLYDELVLLADVRNEANTPVAIERVDIEVGGARPPESMVKGPRIRARGADVIRGPAVRPPEVQMPSLVPGGVAHYVCWAWNLQPVFDAMDGQVVHEVRLLFKLGDRPGISVKLPFRVSGDPVKGFLERVEGGWRLREGWKKGLHDAGIGKIAALLRKSGGDGG